MDLKKMETDVEPARAQLEQILGVPVRVNIRPDWRHPVPNGPPEIHKVQVELEAYVAGPGQQRQEERARADAERAEREAAAQRDAAARKGE